MGANVMTVENTLYFDQPVSQALGEVHVSIQELTTIVRGTISADPVNNFRKRTYRSYIFSGLKRVHLTVIGY